MRVHATPLATQPALDQYAGQYERPPITSYELRVEGGVLRSGQVARSELRVLRPGRGVCRLGRWRGGGYVGMPIEFIRTAAGAVRLDPRERADREKDVASIAPQDYR